jgi:hypothetical protein
MTNTNEYKETVEIISYYMTEGDDFYNSICYINTMLKGNNTNIFTLLSNNRKTMQSLAIDVLKDYHVGLTELDINLEDETLGYAKAIERNKLQLVDRT